MKRQNRVSCVCLEDHCLPSMFKSNLAQITEKMVSHQWPHKLNGNVTCFYFVLWAWLDTHNHRSIESVLLGIRNTLCIWHSKNWGRHVLWAYSLFICTSHCPTGYHLQTQVQRLYYQEFQHNDVNQLTLNPTTEWQALSHITGHRPMKLALLKYRDFLRLP